MEIRTVDVYNNLKNYSCWDYKNYRLTEEEANKCVEALRCATWHPIESEGMPKESGNYLFACKDGSYGVAFYNEKYGTVGGRYDLLLRSDSGSWAVAWQPIQIYKKE